MQGCELGTEVGVEYMGKLDRYWEYVGTGGPNCYGVKPVRTRRWTKLMRRPLWQGSGLIWNRNDC